jgi:cobalt-precorrin 5A hydrolase
VSIRVVALTEAGRRLGERLCALLPTAELDFKPEPFAQTVQQAFRNGERLVMICATGIVLRTLAPVIANKHDDPPVIVLDEAGAFSIPLLSGHEGGANELAAQIADLLGAQLVMTTANPYLQPVYTAGMGCERA